MPRTLHGLFRLVILAIVWGAFARPASGQFQAQATVDVDEDVGLPKPGGFSIKKEDPKVIEQLEDFDRYRDKKAWDKAFKSMSSALESSAAGALAPAKDGFWVPTRLRVMQMLASLPPEGREAYRLFNDAKAKQEYDAILAREKAGDGDTLPQLKKLSEQFLIASIGDKAADRLGDALMEAGDYAGAAQAYDSILIARPDSDLSELRLLAKRATALARGGRWQAFAQVEAQIRDKHPNETVHFGGKDIPVEKYLASLAEKKPAATAAVQSHDLAPPTAPFTLPTTRPAWRHVFLDTALREKITAQLNGNGWMNQQFGAMLTVSPAAVSDGKRIYLNWYGIVWALDIESGKIVWWSSHFAPLADKVNELGQWQVEQRRFAVALAGKYLLTVALRLDRLNNQEPFRLSCLDPATGKKKWSSDTGPLQNWAFIGQPLVIEDTIYAICHPHTAQDIHLLAINLADGALRWENALGQPQVNNNWRGMPVYSVPVLKYVNGTLYVLTNNGAVLAFDVASRTVLWAFSYDLGFQGNENMPMVRNEVPGSAFVREGALYFKDQTASTMYALDLSQPKLLFRRPVDEDQLLVGVDDTGYYLVGSTFSLIDAKTRQLLWAPSLPAAGAIMRPVRSGDDFLVFTDRGIYRLSPASRTLELFHGADLDSLGGSLMRVGDKLIAVSNLSVTAYDVRPVN